MRGWVCSLQLLLVLASAVILRSESHKTHDNILLSQIRDSPQPGGPGPHIYIPLEQGGPVIAPGTGVPFSSPPMTPRGMVEVSDPASTRVSTIINSAVVVQHGPLVALLM
jgi:hypothetical protein